MKNFLWFFLKRLSSLGVSISILLIIAMISTLGTIIEQDQSLAYYQLNYSDDNPLFFVLTWKNIINLGLDHLYTNYGFFVILILFFLSLIVCTFSTQLPLLKYARRWKFFYNKLSSRQINYLNYSEYNSFINFTYLLNIKNYYVFHRARALYAYKGLLGRIAPIFVHISIILTMIGFIFSLSAGFLVQEIIPMGEIFHLQNVVKSGSFSYLPSHFFGKINDFYIDYNEDFSIKQFFSNISILDNYDHVMCSNKISVNHPLKCNHLIIYQTNWQLDALRIQIGLDPLIEKSLQKISLKNKMDIGWWCKLQINEHHKISILIRDLDDAVLLYDESKNLIVETTYGKWNVIYGVPLILQNLIPATGLQIKIDPGIYLTYTGFLVLIISIVVSYVSYSQIWVSALDKLYFAGKTNRAFLVFEDEMMEIYKQYRSLIKII